MTFLPLLKLSIRLGLSRPITSITTINLILFYYVCNHAHFKHFQTEQMRPSFHEGRSPSQMSIQIRISDSGILLVLHPTTLAISLISPSSTPSPYKLDL
ncbi:hypothetical protein HanIR_Chr10g0463791 [Helianthus annuus]|nr:hypothetical protein HanIR_Chr10g0463791 [Helianthus annuus]